MRPFGADDRGVSGALEVVVALLVFLLVLTAYFSVVGETFAPVEQDVPPRSQSVLLSTLLISESGNLTDGSTGGNTSWEDFDASGHFDHTNESNIKQNLTEIGFADPTAGYGVIDREKVEAMRKVPYEHARELLGLDEMDLDVHLSVVTEDGETILNYGPEPRSGGVWKFERVASLHQTNTSVVPVDFAVPEKLILNEFMYHPDEGGTGSTEHNLEWVELYNPTEKSVNASGWHLLGELPRNDRNDEPSSDNELRARTAGNSTIIPPDGYALVTGTGTDAYDVFEVGEDAVQLELSGFSDTTMNGMKPDGAHPPDSEGEKITLVDPQDRTVEFVEFEASWGGINDKNSNENFTLSRVDPYGDANDQSNWENSSSSIGSGLGGGGTPGQTNVVRELRFNRTQAFLTIRVFRSPMDWEDAVVNEIMYHPATGDPDHEYVELYNPTDTAIDLNDWTLTDDGETETLSGLTDRQNAREGILPGKGFAVVVGQGKDDEVADRYDLPPEVTFVEVDDPQIGDQLGDGDSVTISDADGREIESLTYESDSDAVSTDESLERIDPLEPWESSNVDVSLDDDLWKGTPGRENSQTTS